MYVHAIDSGTLEAPEIHAELLALQQPLTLSEVVLLMSEVDIRNDGAVDFSQFKVNYTTHTQNWYICQCTCACTLLVLLALKAVRCTIMKLVLTQQNDVLLWPSGVLM
jgi:hypothetical protein